MSVRRIWTDYSRCLLELLLCYFHEFWSCRHLEILAEFHYNSDPSITMEYELRSDTKWTSQNARNSLCGIGKLMASSCLRHCLQSASFAWGVCLQKEGTMKNKELVIPAMLSFDQWAKYLQPKPNFHFPKKLWCCVCGRMKHEKKMDLLYTY